VKTLQPSNKSIDLNILSFPEDNMIYDKFEFYGYDGYIAKTFLSDLLYASKLFILQFKPDNSTRYNIIINKIISTNSIKDWIQDTIKLYIVISTKYDLRVLENYARNREGFNLKDIRFSFNYSFDIKNINPGVQLLLNISVNELEEIDKLPEDVVKILQMSTGYGNFIKTSTSYITVHKSMQKYGDIIKIKKFKFADYLFDYKFALKSYNINSTKEVVHKSNKLVIGYFLSAFAKSMPEYIILKVLGSIILNYVQDEDSINVHIYELHGTKSYNKVILNTEKEIISYFKQDKQLELFPSDNSVINDMIMQNPSADIVFIPNIHANCTLTTTAAVGKINILSSHYSKFNNRFRDICKSTGGTFLIL